MPLTATEAATLEQETSATETSDEGAPASGEQQTEQTETSTEEGSTDGAATEEGSDAAKTEAEGGDKPEDAKTGEEKTEERAKWKAVEAAKKEQIKLASARRQLAQRENQVRSYEQHLETRAKDLDAREARVQRLETALQSRDLGTLVDLGFDYEAFTRAELERSTPEGRAKLAMEEAKRLREDIEKKDREREERAKAERQIAETRAVAQNLVAIVDDGAAEFPDLFEWPPERIAQEGIGLRDAYFAQTGRMPTYAMVLNELQRRAKAEADVITQRRTTLQQRRSGNTSGAGSAGKADNTKGGSGAPGTPALTAKTAAERPSPPREKTEAEIDAECLAELRNLRR